MRREEYEIKQKSKVVFLGVLAVVLLVLFILGAVLISQHEKDDNSYINNQTENYLDLEEAERKVLKDDVPQLKKEIMSCLNFEGEMENIVCEVYGDKNVTGMMLGGTINGVNVSVTCGKENGDWVIYKILNNDNANIVYFMTDNLAKGQSLYDFNTGKVIMTYEEQESKKEEESKRKEEESKEQEKQEAAKRKEQFIAECKTYSYKEIARMPLDYMNKKAKFTGKVIQVTQSTAGSYTLRVNVTKNSYGYEDTLYVSYLTGTNAPRILEDDIITMYGELQGEKTYTTVLGASVTLPSFAAWYVTIH